MHVIKLVMCYEDDVRDVTVHRPILLLSSDGHARNVILRREEEVNEGAKRRVKEKVPNGK
jgi:hypothetical protein